MRTNIQNNQEWTWADLISTYRFWGLMIFFSLFLGVRSSQLLARSLKIPYVMVGLFYSFTNFAMYIGLGVGLLLAWIAIRTRPLPVLLIAGCLQLAGAGFFFGVYEAGLPDPWLTFTAGSAAICSESARWTILFVITAVIAAGRGGMQSFLVAVAVLSTGQTLLQLGTGLLSVEFIQSQGYRTLFYCLTGLQIVGLLCLLPVRGDLFTAAPPPRGRPLQPRRRDPVAAALLCLVPGYYFYWVYRVHGETSSLRPDRSLLSPRGAVWVSFVPFMIPILFTTLMDGLNSAAEEKGLPRLGRPLAVCLWGFFCAPVAVGLVQARLNRVAEYGGRGVIASAA